MRSSSSGVNRLPRCSGLALIIPGATTLTVVAVSQIWMASDRDNASIPALAAEDAGKTGKSLRNVCALRELMATTRPQALCARCGMAAVTIRKKLWLITR